MSVPIPPIRALCFNDDHQTFTVVLPSHYQIIRCTPFGVVFTRDADGRSLGAVATYDGYRFIALTGTPSSTRFSSKAVQVFDHQTGRVIFLQYFENHILAIALGHEIVVCAMHRVIEVWSTQGQRLHTFETAENWHVPLALSRDSKGLIATRGAQTRYPYSTGSAPRSHRPQCARATIQCCWFGFRAPGRVRHRDLLRGGSLHLGLRHARLCHGLEHGSTEDMAQSMDFSPDGSLATCSLDGSVRILEIRRKHGSAHVAATPTVKLGGEMCAPRVAWLSSDVVAVATLDGIFSRITVGDQGVTQEGTAFLKKAH